MVNGGVIYDIQVLYYENVIVLLITFESIFLTDGKDNNKEGKKKNRRTDV
ncbi:hypothetical protein HNP81_000462 [Peribacillus huizhouensis]|uniref:Uncharacterized protein n=1 Tax=Peribacillus huizhouensis TaxID=1501239 RepID=A0ABR6CJI5_9BACI|nr:hypothetical protein [Peribacillus huizhouensis]